ncbi:surfeit locus protein 2 isoform X4 [Arabidopsis lyrata subsp. lyrata]|uniref:surfeit locus protein 2 isoform X4 n=1 Tax=Arabidopsis lyrata subsp. lyrata TaxID=81972 RepID=UPI000A29D647|nr:surfeit locus protein 2 isoform X4 [Arabidopsis lyrata subsp. lyrata]|eukprot:XP_020879042.1 surfeit locus protein 2 isoform X4 [Arabidopsis lyrata subsp. lyrata]
MKRRAVDLNYTKTASRSRVNYLQSSPYSETHKSLRNSTSMAATEEEMTTTTKEGADLLGKPKYKKLDNGRFKCVQTGHELLEKDKKVYSQSKRCRLGLIDYALSHSKPPLNLFEQDPNARSKLKCKLTGDTVNKTEEHIWKHINGRRFLNRLEEKEREKESGSIPEEGGETLAEENGVKEEEKKKMKKRKNKKKEKKKNKKSVEKEKNGEDVADEVEHENDEAVEEELEFWMPPDGERWDFDDGGDRWGSDSDSEEEMNEEEDPIGEFDEDGEISMEESIVIGEVDEDGKIVLDETKASNKRKPEELSSSDLPSKKKNKKKKKKKNVETTSS